MITKGKFAFILLGCFSILLLSGFLFSTLMIKTSALTIGTSSRYCAVGTGPGTNKACIPCDIGLGSGHCVDTLTGWKPCPRYGPIPPDCTLNPFHQLPENQLPTDGGVLQQPLTTTPPPLFGRNVPLQGGGVFGQPAITAATPLPTPPPFGQIAPEAQVLPPLADDSTFPEDGVLEQPSAQESEEQSSEEDGQVIAKDEDEGGDDDNGPVPPECPPTGPIPPDCTMKPKFPEERALE
jgi:hypothetical protein